MSKIKTYRLKLRTLVEWDTFLRQESGLPGRRANIELAQAVAEEGDEDLFHRYLTYDDRIAPTNSVDEFLAFCGVLGLGKLLSQGRLEFLDTLRNCAKDPRWRIREAVAMALQQFGKVDINGLIREMEFWARGDWLEKRAAAASLSEPGLLKNAELTQHVLQILDNLTYDLAQAEDRQDENFKIFRKGLGYCWSVATAACPEYGKPAMSGWFTCHNTDVRWVMRENLKKKRLIRMDKDWVESSLSTLHG